MGPGRPVRGLTAQQAQTQERDTNIYIYTTRMQHVDSRVEADILNTCSQLLMCCERIRKVKLRDNMISTFMSPLID